MIWIVACLLSEFQLQISWWKTWEMRHEIPFLTGNLLNILSMHTVIVLLQQLLPICPVHVSPSTWISLGSDFYSGSPLKKQTIRHRDSSLLLPRLVVLFPNFQYNVRGVNDVLWPRLTCAGSAYWQLLDWAWQIIHQSEGGVSGDKTVRRETLWEMQVRGR